MRNQPIISPIIAGVGPVRLTAAVDLSERADMQLVLPQKPGDTGGRRILTPRHLRRIDEAIAYIHDHYRDHISAEGLSVEVKLSVARLQAGLRLKTGYSLNKYHEQVRVRAARSLLEETDKRLRVIAAEVGFKTHTHFGGVFKRVTALTPSEYRNRYGC
jgi:transcriptional regulator GlxA family with amidase domain